MKRSIIAAALAAIAAGAYAWCGDGAGYGPRGHWTGPDVQQSLANRNAALESILTLRDNQKQAFKDYTAAQEKAMPRCATSAPKTAVRPMTGKVASN